MSDNGVGIKPEDQDKLFKAFGKLDSNDTMNKEGIGLGLTICQALVTQNGGKIKVHSEGLNKGTTFQFDFVLDWYDKPESSHYNQMKSHSEYNTIICGEIKNIQNDTSSYLLDGFDTDELPQNETLHDMITEEDDTNLPNHNINTIN